MPDLTVVKNAFQRQRATLGICPPLGTFNVFEHAVLPSFGIHGGLAMIAYGLACATNRLELKDYLWPSGLVLNAWWTAVGRHTLSAPHPSVSTVFGGLGYAQKLLLGAVTAWGGRLLYRIVKRSIQRGKDDPRYDAAKREHYFWHKATMLFGLEAIFQTLISFSYTIPFRTDLLTGFTGASAEWAPVIRVAAAGLFTTGLALETLADWQLESHKKQQAEDQARGDQHSAILRTGVWSIVRHPNYLGDALCHIAFPLWCYGSQLFSAAELLGPVSNYVFLRWIGGDRQNEAYQSARYKLESKDKHATFELYQLQKHSFWPSIFEIANPWTWIVSGIGAVGAAAVYLGESRLTAGSL